MREAGRCDDRPIGLHVDGTCSPGFEPVRDAFVANFAERGEVGAAVCVLRRGEVVVDLWGGRTGPADGAEPWRGETLVNVYSVGKAVAATLVLRAIDRAEVGLDTPLVEFWPEFGTGGKEWVTVRHALSHRAAVPGIRRTLTDDDLFDWETMTGALAETAPWWREDERHAYHTNTFGHLTGEIVRRLTGEMPAVELGAVTDELLAGAPGADLFYGVPLDQQGRCADVIWDSPVPALPDVSQLDGDVLLNVLAHFNPPGYSSVGVVNTQRWRSGQFPSTGGHGSARGVARFYDGLLQPDRVLPEPLLREATRPQSSGPCPILGDDVTFGLGFVPTTPRRAYGPNPGAFGHFGTGGALGFADPTAGIAFGYVMNHVIPRWQSTRNRALIDAIYSVV